MNACRYSAALVPLLLTSATLHAQTWDGGGAAGGSLLWSTGTNWSADVAPVNNGTAAVVFGGTIDPTPDMDANWSLASLTFNNTAGAFTLGSTGGFTLTIGSGGITNLDNNGQTINNAIALGSAQTWNSSGNVIFVNGAVNNGGNLLTLTGTGAQLAGVVSGAGGLTLNSGAVTVSGALTNTYSGATQVNGGLLLLQKTAGVNAFGGALTIGDGTGSDEVRLGANNQIGLSSLVTVASSGLFNLFGNSETILQLSVNGGNTTIGAGVLNVATGLTMTGGSVSSTSGSLLLNGLLTTNAAATAATISGNLDLGAAVRNFTIAEGAAANDLDVSAVVTNTGGINKLGPGTLRLSAANNFSGGLTASAGTVALGTNTAAGTGTLTLNGGTIQADGAPRTLANSVSLQGDFTTAGALDLNFSGTATLTGDRTITTNNTGFTSFSGAITASGGPHGIIKLGPGPLAFGGNPANTYTGATIISEGSLFLAKPTGITAVAGSLFIGDGTGTDTVEVNQPEQIANDMVVGIASSGILHVNGGDETIGGLVLEGGSVVTGPSVSLILAGGMASNASPATAGISGNLALGGGTRNFTIADGAAANDVDLSAALSGGTLLKTGPGRLRLSGAAVNAASLTVLVNEGELRLAKSAANAAINSTLTIGDGAGGPNADVVRLEASEQIGASNPTTVNSSGLLDLNGFNETVGNLLLAGGNVATGAGTLMLGSTLTSTTTTSTTTATVSGNLNLAGVKSFFIASSGLAVDVDLSAAISNGGIQKFGAGVLRLGGNNTFAGGITLTEGKVLLGSNTAAGTGTIFISNGTLAADGAARTLANALLVSGSAVIDGTQSLTLNGNIFVNESAVLTKNGSGTLTIGPGFLFLNGAVILNAGTIAFAGNQAINPTGVFTQNGGATISGVTLVNRGQFIFNGGAFNATLQNEGVFEINADFNAQGGFTNLSTVTVGTDGNLSANGTGIVNEGTLQLAGGALQPGGTGPVVNNGEITGFGSIQGSAGFTNNAQITISGGNLTIGGGAQTNAGNISIPAGRQLRLGNPLTNTGTIALAGGTIAGTAALLNNPGGTISGRGTISAPFANSGGTLLSEGGTLNVVSAFASSGLIRVDDGAGLASGAITNTGRIQGDGSLANAITNNGRIEARGTLALGGTVTQNAAGTIAAGTGNTVLLATGLATNAGTLSLSGGTVDNNGFPLNNTGQISGFGTLATGGAGLTNNGSVTLTGGFTTVSGNVTNAAGRQVRVVYDTVLFTGNFTNHGTFKNTSASVVFAATYTENGVYISDPASNWFHDLVVGPGGYLIGGEGDSFTVSHDFLNGSTAAANWDTAFAALAFSGGPVHTVAIAGADLGPVTAGYAGNFAWKSVSLAAGESLTLMDGNLTPGGALYTRALLLGGGLAQIPAITGAGFNIYYSPGEPGNAYLAGGTYPLTGGGSIIPVQSGLTILSSTILPAGAVEISVLGVPGGLHRVEASGDLTTWTLLGNASAAADGTFTYTDHTAPAAARRFYRISFP